MPEGGCLCGTVRYRIDGKPDSSGICHCRTCRKAASTPVSPFLTVHRARFHITHGAVTGYASSPGVTRGFCGRCGSPLTYRNATAPDTIDVMTCSLDDPEAHPPTFHVWTSHALAWAGATDGMPSHAEGR